MQEDQDMVEINHNDYRLLNYGREFEADDGRRYPTVRHRNGSYWVVKSAWTPADPWDVTVVDDR